MNIDLAHDHRAIASRVDLVEGAGGLPMLNVTNDLAEARISLHAGQVLAFRPRDADPVLWVSEHAYYAEGKAIKGGIPICWPWFGPHPEPGKPGHGFVRNRLWQLRSVESLLSGETLIRLGMRSNEETLAIWPHRFDLELMIVVGTGLKLCLTTRNDNDYPLQISQAFHTYFQVGEVEQVAVRGLEGCHYQDKVAGGEHEQEGPVTISGEVDRIYQGSEEQEIDDQSTGRRIKLRATGSHSCVVWNPWIDKAKAMKDFGDEEYHNMICVETANAGADSVTISPGQTYQLGVNISVEPHGA